MLDIIEAVRNEYKVKLKNKEIKNNIIGLMLDSPTITQETMSILELFKEI